VLDKPGQFQDSARSRKLAAGEAFVRVQSDRRLRNQTCNAFRGPTADFRIPDSRHELREVISAPPNRKGIPSGYTVRSVDPI